MKLYFTESGVDDLSEIIYDDERVTMSGYIQSEENEDLSDYIHEISHTMSRYISRVRQSKLHWDAARAFYGATHNDSNDHNYIYRNNHIIPIFRVTISDLIDRIRCMVNNSLHQYL